MRYETCCRRLQRGFQNELTVPFSAGREEDWLPLDNAAKIYPATASLRSPAEFRLAFTLKEPVRLLWLQKAIELLMPRFPYFQVYLRRGFFWYYLQRSSFLPEVQPLRNVPIGILPIYGKTSPLLRISAGNCTVAVDFSHILTDGHGGMRFLTALASEYLKLAGNPGPFPGVMSPGSVPLPEEFEDAHRRHFPRDVSSPAKMKPAWHLSGTPLKDNQFKLLEGTMPLEQMLVLVRSRGMTLTEYLSALHIHCLAEIHSGERRKIIRLEIPVDMRGYFPSATMRNFSLYLSPEIDLELGKWTFDEVASEVHHRVGLLKNEKQLGRQLHRNVGSEMNPFVKYLPLPLKDLLLSAFYSSLGEGLHSGVLSNLGPVDVPEAVKECITSFHVHINPNSVMKKSCAILSYGDKLNITFAGVIEETGLEKLFFSTLARKGIDVTVKELL